MGKKQMSGRKNKIKLFKNNHLKLCLYRKIATILSKKKKKLRRKSRARW